MNKQTFRTTAQKDFAGAFAELCYNKHTWQVWADFVEAAAIALHNTCDRTSIKHGEREVRYHQIMNGYSPKEQAVFPKLFAMLCAALEQNPEQDFLGDMFMRLELGSHWHGQFFTP